MSNEVLPAPLVSEVDISGLPPGGTLGDSPQWSGTEWIIAAGSAFATENILHVMTSGNDNTGTPGNPAKPYATLTAAVAAAEEDQLICVYPGSYLVEQSVSKNGVSWYFYPGAFVTVTDCIMFNNDTQGFSMATCVYGRGSFAIQGITAALVRNMFHSLTLEFDYVSSTSNLPILALNCSDDHEISVQVHRKIYHNWNDAEVAAVHFLETFHGVFQAPTVHSLHGIAMRVASLNNLANITVNCGKLLGATAGLTCNTGVFTVSKCTGNDCGVRLDHYGMEFPPLKMVTLRGTFNSIQDLNYNSLVHLEGFAVAVTLTSQTTFTGGRVCQLTAEQCRVSNVTVGTIYGLEPSIETNNQATVDVTFSPGMYPRCTVTNSHLTVRSSNTFYANVTAETVSVHAGGFLRLVGEFVTGDCDYFIRAAGGRVDLSDAVIYMEGTASGMDQTAVLLDDVNSLVLANGCRLVQRRFRTKPLRSTVENPQLMIAYGGINTNVEFDDIFTANARIVQIEVTSVPTSFRMILGETSVVVEENDTESYNTPALMAERLVQYTSSNGSFNVLAIYVTDTAKFLIQFEDPAVQIDQMQNASQSEYVSVSYAIGPMGPGNISATDIYD